MRPSLADLSYIQLESYSSLINKIVKQLVFKIQADFQGREQLFCFASELQIKHGLGSWMLFFICWLYFSNELISYIYKKWYVRCYLGGGVYVSVRRGRVGVGVDGGGGGACVPHFFFLNAKVLTM